jgi:uncharacterized membrane protein
MSDQPTAGLVTALLVAPICALCILGPAILGGVIGWVSGNGPLVTALVVVFVGAGAIAVKYWRRRRVAAKATGNADPSHWGHASE